MKNERMIINDVIYRFEFLENSAVEMCELGMTMNDVRNAFCDIEEQKEHFEMLKIEDSTSFTFDDLFGRTMVIKKEGNVLKILKVF